MVNSQGDAIAEMVLTNLISKQAWMLFLINSERFEYLGIFLGAKTVYEQTKTQKKQYPGLKF